MKNRIKAALVLSVLMATAAYTKANILTLNLSGLIPIEVEQEEAVDDPNCYRPERTLQFQTFDIEASLETEQPVHDIQFSKEDVKRYQNRLFEMRLDQLLPVEPEVEEPVALGAGE